MKKLFFALALLILTTNGVFAACTTDTDKFDSKGWCIDSAGTFMPKAIAASENGVSSAATQGGIKYPVINVTAANTPRTMLSWESGSIINDMGGATIDTVAGYGSKYTLPRAVAGLSYTFTVGTKSFITVDTLDSADIIMNSISGTGFDNGTSIKSTGQAGDNITLTSTSAGQWSITAQRGSWTNNGAN